MLSKRDAGLPLPEGFRAQEQAVGHAPYYEGRGEDSVHDSNDNDNDIADTATNVNGNDDDNVYDQASHSGNADGSGSGGRFPGSAGDSGEVGVGRTGGMGERGGVGSGASGGRSLDASKRKREAEGDGYRGDGCGERDATVAAAAIDSGRRNQREGKQVRWRKVGWPRGRGWGWEGVFLAVIM